MIALAAGPRRIRATVGMLILCKAYRTLLERPHDIVDKFLSRATIIKLEGETTSVLASVEALSRIAVGF